MDVLLGRECLNQLFESWRSNGYSYAAIRECEDGRVSYLLPVDPNRLPTGEGYVMEFQLANGVDYMWPVLKHLVTIADETWVQQGQSLLRLRVS